MDVSHFTQLPKDGLELYCKIMATIEPDLLPDSIKLWPEKYKHETMEQLKMRGRRYKKAFDEYESKVKIELQRIKKSNIDFNNSVMKMVESISTIVDEDKCESLFAASDYE